MNRLGADAIATVGLTETMLYIVINLGCFWLWQMPLAYVLASFTPLGPRGVFWAIAIAYSTLAVVSGYVFSGGRWKKQVV